jgi:hypothetical protein
MRTAHQSRPPIPPQSAFAGFRFPPDVIVLAVRWYLRFALSYRDVEELLTERGVEVDHLTIYRWVLRFTPLLAEAARPCRHAVGDRWHGDNVARTSRRRAQVPQAGHLPNGCVSAGQNHPRDSVRGTVREGDRAAGQRHPNSAPADPQDRESEDARQPACASCRV